MPSQQELKRQEVSWKNAFRAIAGHRVSDPRTFKSVKNAGAFMTQAILRDRQKLTRGGRQELVMKYGQAKGGEVSFTLRDLNDMATKLERAKGKFKHEVVGIPAHDVIAHSTAADVHRAKNIKTATLFKFTGNTLSFRVQASGDTDTAPSHYQVRIRLEDWNNAITKGEGGKYLLAAKQATAGRVSFDCNCPRYIYWFHYLASIGGFDIAPHEDVFPKIRNPKLRGCACKHVLKTMLVLNSMAVQAKIAAVMQTTAQNTGFTETKRGKFLGDKDLSKLEKAGSQVAVNREFKKFVANTKSFMVKQREPEVKQVQKALNERMIKAMTNRDAAIKQKDADIDMFLTAMLRSWADTAKSGHVTFDKLAAGAAESNPKLGTKEQLISIAKAKGII